MKLIWLRLLTVMVMTVIYKVSSNCGESPEFEKVPVQNALFQPFWKSSKSTMARLCDWNICFDPKIKLFWAQCIFGMVKSNLFRIRNDCLSVISLTTPYSLCVANNNTVLTAKTKTIQNWFQLVLIPMLKDILYRNIKVLFSTYFMVCYLEQLI